MRKQFKAGHSGSLSSRSLIEIVVSEIPAKLLSTALELEIFDLLSEPRSAAQIAQEHGWHLANTELFLNALCACGLLHKDEGLFSNTDQTQTFLSKQGEFYLGRLFQLSAPFWTSGLERLGDLVRNGPAKIANEQSMDPDFWQGLATEMAAGQRAWLSGLAVEKVSALPGAGSYTRMLDLGGGPGMVAIALARHFPNLHCVVFDLPPVTEVAGQFIAQYGLQDRVSTMGGDFNDDELGRDYDLIWASNSLHFAKADLHGLMGKAYQALKPGGFLLTFHEGLTNQRTAPKEQVLNGLMTSLQSHDLFFDQSEIASAMEAAGFSPIVSRTYDTDWGPFDLDQARRPMGEK